MEACNALLVAVLIVESALLWDRVSSLLLVAMIEEQPAPTARITSGVLAVKG